MTFRVCLCPTMINGVAMRVLFTLASLLRWSLVNKAKISNSIIYPSVWDYVFSTLGIKLHIIVYYLVFFFSFMTLIWLVVRKWEPNLKVVNCTTCAYYAIIWAFFPLMKKIMSKIATLHCLSNNIIISLKRKFHGMFWNRPISFLFVCN